MTWSSPPEGFQDRDSQVLDLVERVVEIQEGTTADAEAGRGCDSEAPVNLVPEATRWAMPGS